MSSTYPTLDIVWWETDKKYIGIHRAYPADRKYLHSVPASQEQISMPCAAIDHALAFSLNPF